MNLRQVYPARCSPLELSQIRGRLRIHLDLDAPSTMRGWGDNGGCLTTCPRRLLLGRAHKPKASCAVMTRQNRTQEGAGRFAYAPYEAYAPYGLIRRNFFAGDEVGRPVTGTYCESNRSNDRRHVPSEQKYRGDLTSLRENPEHRCAHRGKDLQRRY